MDDDDLSRGPESEGAHSSGAAEKNEAGISSGSLDSGGDLGDARAFAEAIVDTVREGLLVLDLSLRVVAANESFYRTFGVSSEETLGRLVYDLGNGQWDIPELRELLENVLPQHDTFDGYEVDHEFEGIGRRVMVLNARRFNDRNLVLLAVEDITELRRAERELSASEERFELFAENAREYAVIGMDADARITTWSPSAERILGWTRNEALGQTGAILFTEEDQAAGAPERELRTARAEGSALDERWHVRKNEERFWGTGTLVALHDGEVRGYVKVLRDNTRRREAEDALRSAVDRSERQLQTFGAALGAFEDFVYVLTPDTRFTYANRALLDLWGVELGEVVGKGFVELGYPDDLVALHRAQVDEVVRTGRPVRAGNPYTAPDGREGYYEYIFSPVVGEGGEVTAVAGITRDVTERRRAEESVRAAAAAAAFRAELTDRLRGLYDPVEVQGEAARLLCEHLGATRAHYAEIEPDDEHAVVARDYERGVPNRAGRYSLADFAALHAATRAGRTFVVDDVDADGRLTEAELAVFAALPVVALVVVPLVKGRRLVALLAVHRGEPHTWTGAEVALVEETAERTWSAVERARAEAEVRGLNRVLEERVEDRTAQVRSLSRALTLAEQEERRRLAHVLHDDLQQVLHGAQIQAAVGNAARVEALIGEAIETARSLSHELAPPILRGRGLDELLAWVAERERTLYGLEVDHDGGDVEVPEEEIRILLYRLLRELLFNVVKHAGVGRARVTAEQVDSGVRIVVEDEGAGFAPAALEDPSGRGLGLASVRERLEAVGGRLVLESAPGEGTRVTVDVPLEE